MVIRCPAIIAPSNHVVCICLRLVRQKPPGTIGPKICQGRWLTKNGGPSNSQGTNTKSFTQNEGILKYQTSRGMTGCLGYIQFLWDTPQKETNIFQISSSLISFKWSTPRSIGKVECRRKSEGSKAKDPCKSHRIHVWHIYLHFR